MMHWLVHALYGSWIEMSLIIPLMRLLVLGYTCLAPCCLIACCLWFGGNRAVIDNGLVLLKTLSLLGVRYL
jgi:hypothetical protein